MSKVLFFASFFGVFIAVSGSNRAKRQETPTGETGDDTPLDPCIDYTEKTKCGASSYEIDGASPVVPKMNIGCSPGFKIKIRYAMYGRDDTTTCPSYTALVNPTDCKFEGAMTYVQGMCEGLNYCQIKVASPDPFPAYPNSGVCEGASRYLIVKYKCCPDSEFGPCKKVVQPHTPSALLPGPCPDEEVVPVYLAQCVGGCSSSDGSSGGGFDPFLTSSSCQCCKAQYKYIGTTMQCKKKYFSHHDQEYWYHDVTSCDCQYCNY